MAANRQIAALAALACALGAGGAGDAGAQKAKLDAYAGTIEVTGTEFGPNVSYRASVKVNLPVSSRKADAITAEFLGGEAPDAIIKISHWDISHTEKSADCGGHESNCHRRQPQRQSRLRGEPGFR